MRHVFSSGIATMIGLLSFAGGYFLKYFLHKSLTISLTLLLVAVALVKMLELRDQIFR